MMDNPSHIIPVMVGDPHDDPTLPDGTTMVPTYAEAGVLSALTVRIGGEGPAGLGRRIRRLLTEPA